MSYIVLHKPYVPGDELSGWKSVGFVDSYPEADSLLKQYEGYQRGDLFTVIPLEYVSSVDDHAVFLFVATHDSAVVRIDGFGFIDEDGEPIPWFIGYDTAAASILVRKCMEFDILSPGYLIAIIYEATLRLKAYAQTEFVLQYRPFVKKWIDGELPSSSFVEIYAQAELQGRGPTAKDKLYGMLIGRCLYAILRPEKTKEILDPVFDELQYDLQTKFKLLLRSMLPLREVLLAIVEKRKISLTWE